MYEDKERAKRKVLVCFAMAAFMILLVWMANMIVTAFTSASEQQKSKNTNYDDAYHNIQQGYDINSKGEAVENKKGK